MTRGYRAGAPRTIGWRRLHTALPALIAGCCTLAAAAASLAIEAHALAVSLACAGERPAVHRAADHLGAAALVRRLRRTNRLRDVRLALRRDEVGRGTRSKLRSAVARPRAGVETRILDAGRSAGVNVRWLRDSATGKSDHRELAPAAKLAVPDEPCRHTACDTPDRLRRGAFARVLRVVWPLLGEVS